MLASLLAATALAAGNLSVVAYSIPTNVFPKLEAAYGNGVSFSNSFAASEVQSKAVAAGLPADVVNFSISTDMDRLVQAKLVDKTWDDLVKPGVDVVFPNPFSSGGARWDVMAAYGSQLREHKTPAQARAYLKRLFQHNVPQDTS